MINCRHELVRANIMAQTSLCLQIKERRKAKKHFCRHELVHANEFIHAHIAQTSPCLQIKKRRKSKALL